MVRQDGKPAYSYANLITFAISSTESKRMTLSEIYQWIGDHFPYYRDAGNGWKVRSITRVRDPYYRWQWVEGKVCHG